MLSHMEFESSNIKVFLFGFNWAKPTYLKISWKLTTEIERERL